MPSSIDWTAVEDAIRGWVKTASGLDDEHVIWADQNGLKPTAPYIDIRIGDAIPLGAAAQLQHITDLGRPNGQEVEARASYLKTVQVDVRAFAGTATTGATAARALLSGVQTGIALPSVREALSAAGLSCYSPGRVQNLSAILAADFEARSLLDAHFYIMDSVSEYVPYIASTEIENQMTGLKFTVGP